MQRSKSKTKVVTSVVPALLIGTNNKENETPTSTRKNGSSRERENHGTTRKSSKALSQNVLVRTRRAKVAQHRFQKKTFSHPTWCQYSNKFIWGLNKSGYECRVCGFAVSRRFIADAKSMVCGESNEVIMDVSTGKQVARAARAKVLTIYLPHGAKKSILSNPADQLKNVLHKVCLERGINIGEYVAEDSQGVILDLETTLGNIAESEITFTKRDITSTSSISSITSPREREKKGKLSELKKSNRTKSQATIDRSNSRQRSPKRRSRPDSPSKRVSVSPKRSVIETYDIGKELGSGAFSVVKAATHKETQDVVAIKILDKYDDDDEQTQKFKQEIKIISSLIHENIVQFHELDEDEENFYVVMELVGGGELFDYIVDNRVVKELEAVSIIAQVCKAIEYMHSVGTVHRDLKPENLLFKDSDHKVIKIADFGESKSFKEGNLNTYCGTPDYMAPEIIRGDPYGPEVDVWAIGVITYVMLAGFPPFDGENDVEVFASILSIRYDFPSPEWDKISSTAKNFIQSILVEDPRQRLTATECLQHPWIVENVPLELRVNKISPKNHEDKLTKLKTEKSTDSMASPPPSLDLKRAKPQLKELTEELLRISSDQPALVSELKVILCIVEATSGKSPLLDIEKIIYHTYHKRLIEIQISSLKKTKRGKKISK